MTSTILSPTLPRTDLVPDQGAPGPLWRSPGAPLSPASRLADAVAARRRLWARDVRFDPTGPRETVVWVDDRWEVVLGAWLPGQVSATVERLDRPGVLHVLQGVLEETTWVTATDGPEPGRRHAVVRSYAAGSTRSHGAVHVHDLRNPGPDPALALHVHART